MSAVTEPARRGYTRPGAFLLLALGALFFFQLGARDLVSSHEARAAQNAQRMLDTGEWGLPTLFDNQRDLQKPPGFYWLVAAVGWANGGHVSPWVARLPAALSAVGGVLLVYGFLRREGYGTGALVAAAVLATANHFVAIGRTARIDVPLTFAVAVSLLAFYRGCNRVLPSPLAGEGGGASPPGEGARSDTSTRSGLLCPRGFNPSPGSLARPSEPPSPARGEGEKWLLLSALAAGCAVLLKGPVGLALIGTTAVVFLLVEWFVRRNTGPEPGAAVLSPVAPFRLPLRSAVLGVLVVAAVAVPWFAWAEYATGGEFVRVFFWHHNVARFTGESDALASHPWWYYGPRLALALAPWTLLLVPLVVWGLRAGVWKQDRAFRFGLVWLAVMVAVLSASRFKRADYLLPAFPGAAIALGCAAERWLTARARPRSVRLAKGAFGVLTAGALAVWPVMWFVVEPAEAARQEKRPFAAAVRAAAPAPETILLFRTESHALAFHLGAPLHTLVEWGELKDALAAGPRVVVMPPEFVDDARRITGRAFVPVADLADHTSVRPPRPLVCLRTAE